MGFFSLLENCVSVSDLALIESAIVAVVVVLFAGWYYGGSSVSYFD